ncbi:ferrochelatase [Pseudomarimonas arenosa]|nr:ferrochelatase [Pseudomarimonas arenosa]
MTSPQHATDEFTGVLLVNLGTPEAPTPAAVRRYLAEFLSDPRVVELPRAVWLPLLYGVILPFRSPRSARAYASIWTPQGSPLRVFSQQLAEDLDQHLARLGCRVRLALAMRYGAPSIASVLDQWRDAGLRRLLVLPLYPQYSATTSASVFDAVMDQLKTWRWTPELRWINDYYQEPGWIAAVAERIREFRASNGAGQHLLFSFHGLPQRNLIQGDPYFCQCQASARRIATRLGLAEGHWSISFQSRVGKQVWLQPYTETHLADLASKGIKQVDVVCPGFAVDCLETLEEIAERAAEHFLASGGEQLRYVPALNAEASHVQLLGRLIQRHGRGWPGLDTATAELAEPGREQRVAAYRGPQAP